MEKIKVLHFPLHDPFGGKEVYIQSHWRYMDHTRFSFDLVTRFLPTEEYGAQFGEGCRFIPVTGSVAGREAEFFKKMAEILDRDYSVIHLHTSHWIGGFPMEKLARKKGIPKIIVHAHNSSLDESSAKAPLEQLLREHEQYKSQFGEAFATDFCACSQAAADWLYPKSLPREKVHILKNAVDTRVFSYSPETRAKLRLDLGLGGVFTVGAVGRFAVQKNPLLISAIFKALVQRVPQARMIWIGSGPLEAEVKASLAQVSEKVMFLGNRRDVPQLMQAMDCFLLPSLYEGLPISAVEAQAAGLPCFLSDRISRETEIPIEGADLVTFLPLTLSPDEWATRILERCSGFLRQDTSEAVARAGFDIKTQAKRLEQLYCGT